MVSSMVGGDVERGSISVGAQWGKGQLLSHGKKGEGPSGAFPKEKNVYP